jgi:hypothetical protein
MPAVNAGLYKITIGALTSGNNPAFNVLWYLNSLGEDDISELVFDLMDTVVIPQFRACRYAAYTTDLLKVENIFGTDVGFEGTPTATAGTLTATGDVVAGHIAASLRKFRSTKETRSGWVRVSGFTEGYIAGNVISGELATALEALAGTLEATQTIVGHGFMNPVLVRPPGTYAGGVQSGWLYNPISSVQAILDRVTTQNSRKNW